MSRKTQSRRSAPRRTASSINHLNIYDVPNVERPLSLICGPCGAVDEYDVGTVTLDIRVMKNADIDSIGEVVGFTGYFRCQECGAGGPWELTTETLACIMTMAIAAVEEIEDVPLMLGRAATFDKHPIRYATDGEDHLKKLIDKDPDRAFLWVRLGNLYTHAGAPELAEPAYERAIELDPVDIEAHSMLGQLLLDANQPVDSVPHFHAVLNHVRDARQVPKDVRQRLVRSSIESLLEAHAETNGQIELLPTRQGEIKDRAADEPAIVELREFDLGSEEGMDELCGFFFDRPRRHPSWWQRKRLRHAHDDAPTAMLHREVASVGRNAPCPCGSGHKFKKCCGR